MHEKTFITLGPDYSLEESNQMDGRMTCNFTSFSTVFKSYQDDGRLIKKGCVQCVEKISPRAGIELGLLDQ